MMLLDIDGEPLKNRLEKMIKLVRKNSIKACSLDTNLLITSVIFYKIGLGTSEYQDMIIKGERPLGYEILSSYMMDRFLSKYYNKLGEGIKALLLKSIEEYPKYAYGFEVGVLNALPTETRFLDEAIRLLEELAQDYLGFKPMCRVIMDKRWSRMAFIRWYRRILDDNDESMYGRNKSYVDSYKKDLIDVLSNLEKDSL